MWRGDFTTAIKAMGDIARGFDRVARGELQADISSAMARRGKEQLLGTFAKSQTPDGERWKPLVVRVGGKPLVLTHEMERSSDCDVGPKDDAGGFDLTYVVRDEKAIWHQAGTKRGGSPRKSGRGRRGGAVARQHIPPRRMLFENAAQAGPWRNELEDLARDRADKWMTATFRRI